MSHTVCDPAAIAFSVGRVMFNRPRGANIWRMRIHELELSRRVRPGQFVQVDCDPDLTLRRPFSVLSANPARGTVDLLYKVVGQGTQAMTTWPNFHSVELMGPIGRPFTLDPPPKRALLVAGGVGVAPLFFLARRLLERGVSVILLFGSESQAPFRLFRTARPLPGLEGNDWLTIESLARHGAESRLASLEERPGWFPGLVTDLAERVLLGLAQEERAEMRIYACGPHPMMAATARLAQKFSLTGEASMEARMACGFGVCQGCVIPVAGKYARTCVDGPVFPLGEVDWDKFV